jgi:hypothetical protein
MLAHPLELIGRPDRERGEGDDGGGEGYSEGFHSSTSKISRSSHTVSFGRSAASFLLTNRPVAASRQAFQMRV